MVRIINTARRFATFNLDMTEMHCYGIALTCSNRSYVGQTRRVCNGRNEANNITTHETISAIGRIVYLQVNISSSCAF